MYRVIASTDECGVTEVDMEEWVIRSIQKKRRSQRAGAPTHRGTDDNRQQCVNLSCKIRDVTWCRQSRKVADFGWAKSIPSLFRISFEVGSPLPAGFYTTKLAALKYAKKHHEFKIERCRKEMDEIIDTRDLEEWQCDLIRYEKELKAIKSRLTRLRNAAKGK